MGHEGAGNNMANSDIKREKLPAHEASQEAGFSDRDRNKNLQMALLRRAEKLYDGYLAKGKQIPEYELDSVRRPLAQMSDSEFSAFRSFVGAAAWAKEVPLEFSSIIFDERSARLVKDATAVSDFAGFTVPPAEERFDKRIKFSQLVLEAHRAFQKKLETVQENSLTPEEAEKFRAAEAADGHLLEFLTSIRDEEIAAEAIKDQLRPRVRKEIEWNRIIKKPKTEAELREEIARLMWERDQRWSELRGLELKNEETSVLLPKVIFLSDLLKEYEQNLEKHESGQVEEEVPEVRAQELVNRFFEKGEPSEEEFEHQLNELYAEINEEELTAMVIILLHDAKRKRGQGKSRQAELREKMADEMRKGRPKSKI